MKSNLECFLMWFDTTFSDLVAHTLDTCALSLSFCLQLWSTPFTTALRWVICWARVRGSGNEANFLRRRDSAIGPEWKTDVSKQEGNAEENACVRHCCFRARRANDIYLTVKTVYRETCSWWHRSLGKGVGHALALLNHTVLYKHWNLGFHF